MKNPSSRVKFLIFVRSRSLYGSDGYQNINRRIGNSTADKLRAKGTTWHRNYFQETVHTDKLKRGKDQVWEGDRQGGFIWTHSQRGRPSIKCPPTDSSYEARCSSLQMVYTFTGEYFHKRSLSAMVIIQKSLAHKKQWWLEDQTSLTGCQRCQSYKQ